MRTPVILVAFFSVLFAGCANDVYRPAPGATPKDSGAVDPEDTDVTTDSGPTPKDSGSPKDGCAPLCDSTKNCGDSDGCGGVCTIGFCGPGLGCNAGVCEAQGDWVVTVVSGVVASRKPDGTFWDQGLACTSGDPTAALACNPDPQVCMTIGGSRKCTPVQSDTLTPSWSFDMPAADVKVLRAGVKVEFLDDDGGAGSEVICTVNSTPTVDWMASWTIKCPDGKSQVNATLNPL